MLCSVGITITDTRISGSWSFCRHPDARANAAELIQHPYLKLPEGWVFNDFK